MNNKLYDAAMARAIADKQTAMSTLEVYFNNPVAIGEHPDFATEIDKYIDILSNALDKINALNHYHREISLDSETQVE
jgi:hypothetical protein